MPRPFLAWLAGAALLASGPAHAQDDRLLDEIETFVAGMPVANRLGPDDTRRCFVLVQSLLDREGASWRDPLAVELEGVCYDGLASELERLGLFHLVAAARDGDPIPAEPVPEPMKFRDAAEEDAFALSVMPCWNIGALSLEALQTTVVAAFTIDPDGRPDVGSIELVSHSGESMAAAQQAYESVRRAIIRCGVWGFPESLRPGRYTVTFRPEEISGEIEE